MSSGKKTKTKSVNFYQSKESSEAQIQCSIINVKHHRVIINFMNRYLWLCVTQSDYKI